EKRVDRRHVVGFRRIRVQPLKQTQPLRAVGWGNGSDHHDVGQSCRRMWVLMSDVQSRLFPRQNGQVCLPRADLSFVALRHDTSDLRDVTQVMGYPGRQELSQCHCTERRVLADAFQVTRRELPASQRSYVRAPELVEFM